MITKTFKTTSGKMAIKIATSIDEISIGQMIELQQEHLTDPKAIAILSGKDIDEIYNIRDIRDLSEFSEHVKSLCHQINYQFKVSELPKTVIIDGKSVKVPKNLEIEPAGAVLNTNDIIVNEINEHIRLYGESDWKEHFQPALNSSVQVLTHFFYYPVTGDLYNDYKVEEFSKKILDMPITQAFPIARHFFLSWPNLKPKKISFWAQVRQIWNDKRALKRLKSLDI